MGLQFDLNSNDNPMSGPLKAHIDEFAHMRLHADWWEEARGRLDWQQIASYNRDCGPMEMAEPVVLRSAYQWVFGCWYNGGWARFTEGGIYPLAHFEPTQWAEPTLDDAILLGQE